MKLFSPNMSKLHSAAHMIFTRFRRTSGEAVDCVAKVRPIAVGEVKGRRRAGTERLPHAWQAACLLILVAAAVLRLYHLSLKPLHHDEGVNAYFLERLFRQGAYQYDPANYHGPTLYYFALLISSVIEIFSRPNELTAAVIRLVPALFGIATVALLLSLRKQLGDIGVLAAAALVAVSPGAVYFSRDFIHEALLVFFTVAVPVALLRYRDTLKPSYLMLASVAAALMFATKETAAISAVVLLLALLGTFLCSQSRVLLTANADGLKPDLSKPLPPGDGLSRAVLLWVLAAVVFVALYALFYSSFLGNPSGIYQGFATFQYWARTGSQQHRAPWYTYLRWMKQAELPILGLGIAGTLVALWRRRNRFALFAGLWAFGLLSAYSLLPYKTPWLMLNYIVPMAIASGYAVQAAWDSVRRLANDRHAQLMLAFVALILVASLTQSISLNFFRYDDARLPYVYMQTRREVISLLEEINEIVSRSGLGRQTAIMVTSPDYWPLPWYLRDYNYVGYPGRVVPLDVEIIVASEAQERELVPFLANNYRRIGSYPLRPAVTLVLYERNMSKR
jgi:uncharacterized protein (TIGR03663 family)